MFRAILKRKQIKSFPDAPDMDSGGESSDNDEEDGEENMGYCWGIADSEEGGGRNRKRRIWVSDSDIGQARGTCRAKMQELCFFDTTLVWTSTLAVREKISSCLIWRYS